MSYSLSPDKRLVFILDDEPAIRDLVQAYLAVDAFVVMEFGDIASAEAALETHIPDLIILDLELGTGDAIEAMRGFAEQGYTGVIQLISGRGEAVLESVQAAGARHGFNFLPPLPKPFRISQLRKAVESLQTLVPAQHRPTPARPVPGPSFTLDQALERGWLELWYQPKLDLQSGRVAGAEGLIRARHPAYGTVGPDSFLPNATDDELSRLTQLIVLSALRDWETFYKVGQPLLLCVNVSASALVSVPIAQLVRENRPRTDAWPGLILGVTEDQILGSISQIQEVAAQLQIYGVRLGLNDFCQGYSSLARLCDLPFQELKIDRSFVTDSALDPVKRDLCQTIVEMGHRFGCMVVAEGIDTQADLNVLKATGCNYGQGCLIGWPTPKDDLIRRLQEGSL